MSATHLAQTSHPTDERAEGVVSIDAAQPVEGLKPFVGLIPLAEEHAKLLAGRDEEIKILMSNLRAARLTVVYGASGVGKSSILRAGVVASLRKLGEEELNNFGTPSFAIAILSSWASDPFVQLNQSIEDGIKAALDVETLDPTPVTTDLVQMLRTWTDKYGMELLLILDQFEEFFLYHNAERSPGTFAHELPMAVNASDLRVRFLISLRDDSLHLLDRFQSSLPALFENRLQITALSQQNARQAIEKAISAYNETQPATEQVQIGDGLINTVLEQVRVDNVNFGNVVKTAIPVPATTPTRSAVDSFARGLTLTSDVDAPYMQLVMSRLWSEESAQWKPGDSSPRVLRLETLSRLGGAQAVVQQHLDKVLQNFTAHQRDIAADCFRYLVTQSGTKYALTPTELKDFTHHPAKEINELLDKLAAPQYRIMRRIDKKTMRGTGTAYEAHHDRLAAAMLDWRARREENRQLRRKRFRVLLIAILVGIPVLVLMYHKTFSLAETLARWKITKAEDEKNAAQNNANAAQANANYFKQELTNVNSALTNANKAEETADDKLRILKSAVPKFVCGNRDPRLQQDVEEIKQKLGIDCTQIEQIKSADNTVLLRPRIYFHIQSEEQRAAAEELKKSLVSQVFTARKTPPIVPGIEIVGPRNLRESELRYFHPNSADETNLGWEIVFSLKQFCVDVKVQPIKGYENSDTLRPRHFELWLTPDALNNLCVKDKSAPTGY